MIRYFIYLFILYLKDAVKIVLYLNKCEHIAVMRKQPIDFWGYPNYA